MRLSIERSAVKVYPDPKRVIARFFFTQDERSKELISRVMELSEAEVFSIISPILQEYSKRHRNITRILNRHCEKVKRLIVDLEIDFDNIPQFRKLLLGSYFTHEYSIESAAFFNPSIIEDPDQTELVQGQKRMIVSFRAVGEGHISSIVFRRAIVENNGDLTLMPSGNYVDEAELIRNAVYVKTLFFKKAADNKIDNSVLKRIKEKLGDEFEYHELQMVIQDLRDKEHNSDLKLEFKKVLWLSDSFHDISFSRDTDISDRVIFPISQFERKGIEDARFVRFLKDDGTVIYYATYTAFDGHLIMPKLLQTTDFYDFKVCPLHGEGAQNKNLALFPRKINGKYAMMSRIDGWNNYIMYSDNIQIWEHPVLLQKPHASWEYIQIGNCGSPIETEDGWLIITHGVGPMRRYCLGASLLKLDDPTVEIGRLSEPLIIPNKDEREGYVPNVLYSCGSIIHNDTLIIPYGSSDYCSSFAFVDVHDLLDRLKSKSSALEDIRYM